MSLKEDIRKQAVPDTEWFGDRELLELAAKAVGIDYYHQDSMGNLHEKKGGTWNPLTNDGDALRLAVKLTMSISYWEHLKVVSVEAATKQTGVSLDEPFGEDLYAATRRAIVRAAAEIGRTMG